MALWTEIDGAARRILLRPSVRDVAAAVAVGVAASEVPEPLGTSTLLPAAELARERVGRTQAAAPAGFRPVCLPAPPVRPQVAAAPALGRRYCTAGISFAARRFAPGR